MVKVAILNNFLATFGGGEKNTYAVASTLARLGFDVDVVSMEERVPTEAQVSEFYGPGHDGFRIVCLGRGVPPEARDARLTEHLRAYTVLMNQCAGSSFVNPCPLGVYFLMFPFQGGGEWLKSYGHFVCNSHYTERYARLFWDAKLPTTVIYPSVDVPAADAEAPRQREILAIGRFVWEGHAKNQDLLARAFEGIADKLPAGYVLTLLGRVHQDPETLVKMDELRHACRRLPVRFELDVTDAQKRAALGRAQVFWHATGLGKTEPAEAYRMEHFGIAIVEAMRSGAIPMSYHRGGPREIIRHGESGFLYRDVEELQTFTTWVAQAPRTAERLRRAAIERSHAFSRAVFDDELARFMAGVVAA